MLSDHDFRRAEADYLRPPTERAPRCPHCREAFDEDAGVELDAAGAAHLALPVGDVVCPGCADDVREDLYDLGLLRHEWQKRAAGVVSL